MPKLVGKRRVHIVSIGDNLLPFLPILVRLLASQSRQPRLKALRMTTVSYFKLMRRYGKTIGALRDPSRAARVLFAVAADAGLEFEYQGVEMEDDSMELLRDVETREGEPVAVISADSLRNASENVGIGALTETMKVREPSLSLLLDRFLFSS